jgi:hypothetical protein
MYIELIPELIKQLLPSLVLPLGITLYYKVFNNNSYSTPAPPRKKRTKWDYLVYSLLAFGLLYEGLQLTWNKPYDIFKATGSSPDLRSYELRKVFQQVVVPKHIQNEDTYLTWWNSPYKPTVKDMAPTEELQALHLLSHRLRSTEGRTSYSKFGHSTLTQCAFCQDDKDYALFLLPNAITPYLVALTLIGFASINFYKEGWRFWSILILLALLTAQAIVYIDFRNSEYLKLIGYDLKSFYCDFHQLTHLVLLSLYASILAVDIPPSYSNMKYSLQSIQQNLMDLEELTKMNHYYDLSLKIDKSLVHQLAKEANHKHPLVEFVNDPKNKELVERTLNKAQIKGETERFYDRLMELIKVSEEASDANAEKEGDKKNK